MNEIIQVLQSLVVKECFIGDMDQIHFSCSISFGRRNVSNRL